MACLDSQTKSCKKLVWRVTVSRVLTDGRLASATLLHSASDNPSATMKTNYVKPLQCRQRLLSTQPLVACSRPRQNNASKPAAANIKLFVTIQTDETLITSGVLSTYQSGSTTGSSKVTETSALQLQPWQPSVGIEFRLKIVATLYQYGGFGLQWWRQVWI